MVSVRLPSCLNERAKSFRGRPQNWEIYNILFYLYQAYTANMASFLVSKNELIEHISTIEDALRTGTPVCVQRGAVIDELLSDKYPELKLVRKSKESEMFTYVKFTKLQFSHHTFERSFFSPQASFPFFSCQRSHARLVRRIRGLRCPSHQLGNI